MGACFSFQLDEQHSFDSNQDENKTSLTEDAVQVPSKQSVDDSSKPESSKSVSVFSRYVNYFRKNNGYSILDSFTYNEMRMATKLFRNTQVLGEGGFGVVYKGIIDESVRSGYTRTEVAIKKLDPKGMQGEKEWLTEINYLARLRHPNLVKLFGYCCEKSHRLLVYEYMEAGCLEDHLFVNKEKPSKHVLSWDTRMKIALQAARGLDFLHSAETPVIYRDFKSSNILLDAEFNAKLSDFGIAKDGPMGLNTHVSTRVVGTMGYTAPDYIRTGHLRFSVDVYAFGVVLLELMMGLRAYDRSRPSVQHSLVEWANPYLNRKSALLQIMDPRIDGQYPSKHAVKLAKMAHKCVEPTPNLRPTMSQIIEILESVQKHEELDPKRTGKSSEK